MNKIRVLHIGKYYHPYRGGFESSLYTLINELKNAVEFKVLAAHTGCTTAIEKMKDVTIVRLANFGKIFSQPITPTLPFWIKNETADIVHLHMPNPLAMISYLIASPPGKLVVSYHNDIIRQKGAMVFLRPFVLKLLEKACAIVVTSENLINGSDILKRFRAKCRVIPHGIDITRFELTPEILNESRKVKNRINKPVILFVGRLVSYKGLGYLIKAMRDIDAKLLIIGTGPQELQLRILARILNVRGRIEWLGDVPDEKLSIYYNACDLFVLPSCANSESFGLVILEAHAARKPVVSTDLPTGVTFTNLNEVTGCVVPPRDSLALAQAINRLLGSKDLKERYGENGRERAKNEFSKEMMAERFLTLYSTISKI